MGGNKKGGSSWISTIKKVFIPKHSPPSSPAPLTSLNEADKKSLKKENKSKGVRSRIRRTLFREPSSIEKILADIDQHHLFIPYQLQSQSQPQPPPQLSASSSARPASPPPPPPPRLSPPSRINSPPNTQITPKTEPTLQQQHRSATRIQAAYRSYLARKKVKGLAGLVRLQGVVRGQNVKRQTVNAMKQMQLLVRVQTQIQSRRIQVLQNQRQPNNNNNNNDKQVETSLSEMGDEYYWDDSLISKGEREARLQRKVEAVIRRERAMAYAYSQQVVGKGTPTSAKTSLMDVRTPWWWNWLEGQLPASHTKPIIKPSTTPDHLGTPRSSMIPPRSRSRSRSRMMRYSKASGGGSSYPVSDNDSLMSCPAAFSVPNYMSPTVSAKAKARPTKDRVTTPGSTPESSRRRFSFPFTPNNKWNKSPGSIGDLSIDSAISMLASMGRKPFNRFV